MPSTQDPVGVDLVLSAERVSQLLLGGQPPEEELDGLLEDWIAEGSIERGALFLRTVGSWELVSSGRCGFDGCRIAPPGPESGNGTPSRQRQALNRILAQPCIAAPGSRLPHLESPLVAFSLGTPDDEVGRLVIRPPDDSTVAPLPPELYTMLTLYLRGLRHQGRAGSVTLQGHLARTLFSLNGAGEHSLGRSSQTAWRRDFPEIIGRSAKLAEALDTLRRAAPQDVTVLILGESGAGKELFARAIHRLSARRRGPFVSENCAAFPETLFESEIFGSEKGAYTGAERARAGLMEQARGGTLFLDEIAELGGAVQSKLLRALQEREVRRVGGDRRIPVDFRLVAATHRDLEEEVRAGRFRLDLLFRVQVVTVRVPSLRERREDIPLLAQHFVGLIAQRRMIPPPPIDQGAMEVLANCDWPGNIRELHNEMERAVTLTPETITADSLSSRFQRPLLQYSISRQVREELGANLETLERMLLGGVIRDVLEEAGGNKTHAARVLGIPKTSLYRRLQKYGISARARRA